MDGSAWLTVVTAWALASAAGLAMWVWIAVRLIRHEPILPFAPRRPVPWGGRSVLLIMSVFFAPLLLAPLFGHAGKRTGGTQHPIVTLIHNEPSWPNLCLVAWAATVVAPIVEEFIFRLVIQGWLEKAERQSRRSAFARKLLKRLPPRWSGMLRGVFPVLLVSLLFASLHFPAAESEPRVVVKSLVQDSIYKTLVLAVGVAVLRVGAHATAIDFGVVRREFWRDARLGVLTFLAIAAPIFVLQGLLRYLFHDVLEVSIAADPFTLVPFAVVLGILYYRTHRIVPSLALHVCLNATSLALLVCGVG